MESCKLEKKIRDWAISLGFRLPDGSAPSTNYFILLTATPHRRHLWETLIELVQPRQKIEHIRKQILVTKLQNGEKFARSNSRHVGDRIELWHKQNKLENEIKEKRYAVIKLENNIMSKASDLLFEICKLAELEKQFEELEEKSLLLKLFSRKEKEIMEVIGKNVCKEDCVLNSKDYLEKFSKKENPYCFKNELMSADDCKTPLDNNHDCELLQKFEDLCKFGITEECLWEEAIRLKRNVLEMFSAFLEELNSSEKNILCEKKKEIEKNLSLSIRQLKQKMIEKSFQVIINSTEGKLLDSEIKALEEGFYSKRLQEKTLNDTISSITFDGMNESREEDEKTFKNLKNYLNSRGLKSYEEFLKKELKRLEEEWVKTEREPERKEFKNGQQGIELGVNVFESVVDEIHLLKSEAREIEKQIFHYHDKLEVLAQLVKEEIERKSDTRAVEVVAEKVKLFSQKGIGVLSEIPLEAFRTIESRPNRIIFECESESHCLKNYGGEIKQFFCAMLIPPFGDVQIILSKIGKRKKIIKEIKKFVSERKRLTVFQRKIQNELSSLNYDSPLCEKNFKESDGILWNIFLKTDELLLETNLIEKVLKNWVEQPYRFMIKDMPEGTRLREYEEKCKREK